MLAPRLLELLEQRFPQLLGELLFLRAQRLSALAAQRLLRHRTAVVLEGTELAAQELLEAKGLGHVADCFFRDPSLWAVAEAQRRRQRRRLRRRLWRHCLLYLLMAGAGEPKAQVAGDGCAQPAQSGGETGLRRAFEARRQ